MNYFQKRALREQEQAQSGLEGGGALGGSFQEAASGVGESFAAGGAAGDMPVRYEDSMVSFGRTMQADDPRRQKMREDYGWKMTGEQYEAMEKQRGLFEGEIKRYGAEADQAIAKSTAETQADIAAMTKANAAKVAAENAKWAESNKSFQAQLAQGQNQLNKAYMQLKEKKVYDPGWYFNNWYGKQKKVPVRVVHGNSIQGTYYMPRSVADSLHGKLRQSGISAGWVDGGRNYNIEVRQGGRIRGKEMHDIARGWSSKEAIQNAFWADKNARSQYDRDRAAYNQSLGQYNSAVSAFNQQRAQQQAALNKYKSDIRGLEVDAQTARTISQNKLKSAIESWNLKKDTEIGTARERRRGTLDSAKAAYQERAKRRRSAYAGLQRMSGTKKRG